MQGLTLPPLSSLPSSCNLFSRLDPDLPWKTHTDHDTSCPQISHDFPFLEGLRSSSLACLPTSCLCDDPPHPTSLLLIVRGSVPFQLPCPSVPPAVAYPCLTMPWCGHCFVEPVFLVGAKPLQDAENALSFLQPYRLARLLVRKYFSNAC